MSVNVAWNHVTRNKVMSVDGRHDKSFKKTDSILGFQNSTKMSDLCNIKMEDILVAF